MAALNLCIAQPLLVAGVALTHVQDLTLGLVEPHKVHKATLLKLVQIPLDGLPSFWHVTSFKTPVILNYLYCLYFCCSEKT